MDPRRCCLLLLMLSAAGMAAVPADHPARIELEGVPPSPATAPGTRIWPDPAFSHWPAIIYADEARNCALRLPLRTPGAAGELRWGDGRPLPFTLPERPDWGQVSGLVPLPRAAGVATLTISIGIQRWSLDMRVVDITAPWPHHGLQAGYPVDADGRPVVLRMPRRDAERERRWALLRPDLPRPTGPILAVGDGLDAMGGSIFDDLDAEIRIAIDHRHPHHAALVALAHLPDPLPRSLIWSPGNQALHSHTWSQEEVRVLEVMAGRFMAKEVAPQLILVLPPLPVDADLLAQADERRALLARVAGTHGWRVVDAGRAAGPSPTATEVAPGLHTRYPHGAAQQRIRDALAMALE